MDAALDLQDDRERRALGRAGLLVIAAFAGGLAAWSALAPLAGAVVAAGVVKVDTQRKVVQHQEGGLVSAILVRNGQKVAAGETLVLLHDVQADAGLEAVQTQLDAELARHARLTAESGRSATLGWPAELASRRSDTRVATLMAQEQGLFDTRRSALAAQLALLHRQAGDTAREIDARSSQAGTDDEALRLHREELDANEPLVRQGFISAARLRTLQREATEAASRTGTNRAELAQARQRVAELQLRTATLASDFRQQADRELKESTARVFELQQRLRPLADARERQRITAPVAGEVVDLQIGTVGAAVGPRERLMDIVPTDPDLVVEVQVRPEDVAHVRAAQAADVRLTAYPQRQTPVLPGRVAWVSADRLTDPMPGAPGHYLAHVKVDRRDVPAAIALTAGMPAEVHLKTAERSLFDYLSEPVLGTVRRGLREP